MLCFRPLLPNERMWLSFFVEFRVEFSWPWTIDASISSEKHSKTLFNCAEMPSSKLIISSIASSAPHTTSQRRQIFSWELSFEEKKSNKFFFSICESNSPLVRQFQSDRRAVSKQKKTVLQLYTQFFSRDIFVCLLSLPRKYLSLSSPQCPESKISSTMSDFDVSVFERFSYNQKFYVFLVEETQLSLWSWSLQ